LISENFNRKLFEKELQVLESARADIAAGKHENSALLTEYKKIVDSYDKLLTLTRKIFKINDLQGKSLLKREGEIKNLLDNAGQGFLTFGMDVIVDRGYSAECERIFGRKISNMNVLKLLSGDDYKQNELIAGVLQDVWEKDDAAVVYEHFSKLPKVIKINELYLALQLKPILPVEGNEPLIMLILTDITEKLKAEEQVAYLSYHDKLTSLYNRAYVDEWLLSHQPGEHYPLSVIMVDLNGLKLTNDVFGHVEGDRLLVKLAQVMTRSCRKKDIIARWGGDEFIILLPETDMKACVGVCERIKVGCEQEKDYPVELSVALGMATQQNYGESISNLFGIAENRMYSNKLQESKEVRRKILLGLEEILHAKCYEDQGHIERIKKLSIAFAMQLGFKADSAEIKQLTLLAGLHDIGKVAVPRDILGKPCPLTPGEWEIVRSHSEIGYRMAQSIGETAVGEIILALHERWDGQGYPLGLRGKQIPLLARLLAIVDAYDVMTHDRVYRQALSREEALLEIEQWGGKQFDPELASLFVTKIKQLVPRS